MLDYGADHRIFWYDHDDGHGHKQRVTNEHWLFCVSYTVSICYAQLLVETQHVNSWILEAAQSTSRVTLEIKEATHHKEQ